MSVFTGGHVHLQSGEVMLAVLAELVGEDASKYRGTVSCWPEQNPPGPAKWSIEVNDWKGNQVRADLGDHLVVAYGYLLKLTDAEYAEQEGS